MSRVRTALVTGSEGFIGRHMTRRLMLDGWTVEGCDIKTGRDCRDLFAVDDTRFDLVVHCAAIVGGRATIDGQPLRVATDLAIDSDFFQYVARSRPGRAVYFSSSAAYPIALQTGDPARRMTEPLIDAASALDPDAIYGWAKLTGERVAALVNADLDCVHVFRPFSGYGHDQDLDYPFPKFIDRARLRLDPFEIWGTGRQVRDWVHVDDVVDTVMAVLPESPTAVGPLNICTGRPTPFLVLADMVTKAAGYSPGFVTRPDAPTGVQYRVGDPTAMNAFHTAKVTLEEGIHRAFRAGGQ